MSSSTYKIRPAGRHILTIGRDLIQDPYAAIVELVKNAYDADASNVILDFSRLENDKIQVVISDNGHGMAHDIVVNKWMVPSTSDKKNRKTTPYGRQMQGRKGIGRYAASILGNELFLETISNHKKTSLSVDWNQFEKATYLEDVEILIKTTKSNEPNGTKLTILGDSEYLNKWSKKQFDKLNSELKKLKSPVEEEIEEKDKFDIFLKVKNFSDYSDIDTKIVPYPLFNLYDYKISGQINSNGKGQLIYSLQKARNTTEEIIDFDYGKNTECGSVDFDIRVFDREAEAIDSLIRRGLKDEHGNYVGKLEARRLLNEYNGIGVYRNGFRIRPLGDPDFDWLKLNEKRVQKPTQKIGLNQIIGIVKIENEDISNLKEKSARDGLIDNLAYENLVSIMCKVIIELETRRFMYRKKTGLSRPTIKIESEFEKLFSFDNLKTDVKNTLSKGKVDSNITADVLNAIEESEKEKNKIMQSLKETVAIYQGQATLGKIINVILHEGRKPLNFFKNQIPILEYYYKEYSSGKTENLPEISNKLKEFFFNSNVIVQLFGKIDPLAAGKRGAKKDIQLKKEIEATWSIFNNENQKVKFITKEDVNNARLNCWRQDIYSIFTNLIENSIYWMTEKDSKTKEIEISINTENGKVAFIDYKDTGPGIEPSLIESGVIFDPEFSTKPDGTGLGLSIAGEAAKRMGFTLKALSSETGAYFRLEWEETE